MIMHLCVSACIMFLRILSFFVFQKQYSRLREGLLMLLFCSVGLLFLRFCLMGSKPPEFAPSDNPAADSKSFLTRTLTFHYLLTLNLWLLLCPYILSFDWSMNSIPLVESLGDSRNIITIAFYCGLLYIAIYILKHISHCTHVTTELHSMQHSSLQNSHSVTHSSKVTKIHRNGTAESHLHPPRVLNGTRGRLKNFVEPANHQNMTITGEDNNKSSLDCIIFSLAIIIVPFIPATNLFFYVGFVIAERVLYIPSMGFCMLVAKGAEKLYFHYHSSRTCRIAIVVNVICILVSFTARTFLRNQDWLTEEYLYRSGIDINPAKGKFLFFILCFVVVGSLYIFGCCCRFTVYIWLPHLVAHLTRNSSSVFHILNRRFKT